MSEFELTFRCRKKRPDDAPRVISLEEAKKKYKDRFTMEHAPKWARKPMGNGMFFAPQFRTDQEWYDNTKFPGEGAPGNKTSCMSSNLSWPLGSSLDKPYSIKDETKSSIFD